MIKKDNKKSMQEDGNMNNFVLDDQLLMAKAKNYNKWLFSIIEPYIKGNVLEIGAGNGNITRFLLEKSKAMESLTCVEIEKKCCDQLVRITSSTSKKLSNRIINQDFMTMENAKKFNCVIMINVLEHIEDDEKAIEKICNLLDEKGVFICFVPAFQMLYGTIDQRLNHFRRYSKNELLKKLKMKGLSEIKVRYFNSLGFPGWLINNRILKLQSQNFRQIKFFDKYIFPQQIKIESIIEFPFGQSLFCVSKKTRNNSGVI